MAKTLGNISAAWVLLTVLIGLVGMFCWSLYTPLRYVFSPDLTWQARALWSYVFMVVVSLWIGVALLWSYMVKRKIEKQERS